MNVDCSFFQGKGHHVCQDFAFVNKAYNRIIISDGCSGSPMTDVGARILSLSANKMVNYYPDIDLQKIDRLAISEARNICKSLNLDYSCLDATLGYAGKMFAETSLFGQEIAPLDMIYASLFGDGIIVFKLKNKTYLVYTMEYISGYPAYLNYLHDAERMEQWKSILNAAGGPEESIIQTEISYDSEWKEYQRVNMKNWTKPTFRGFHTEHGCYCFAVEEDVEWVALLSDGVNSFTRKGENPDSIPLEEVLKVLLDFRNTNGSFVQRQVNWFQKEIVKLDWQNFDDVSVAVLNVS